MDPVPASFEAAPDANPGEDQKAALRFEELPVACRSLAVSYMVGMGRHMLCRVSAGACFTWRVGGGLAPRIYEVQLNFSGTPRGRSGPTHVQLFAFQVAVIRSSSVLNADGVVFHGFTSEPASIRFQCDAPPASATSSSAASVQCRPLLGALRVEVDD